MFWSFCYVVLRRVLQLVALRFRSNAFKELEIDQLYYLAREKAEREAGPDREAYDVKLSGSGVPLTGDDERESWPASYKVRERK